MVADDHAERAARAAGPRARTLRRAGCSATRSRTRGGRSGRTPIHRWCQWPPIRSSPPSGGPIVTPRLPATRTAEYAGLALLRRDEVGDHRLVGGAAERAEDGQQREQRQARDDVVADEEQPERDEAFAALADQDHRPATDPVGRVAAEVADEPGRDRARQVGERERLDEAWSSLIAQIPRNGNIVEPAIEPIRLTAIRGRSAGSTSPPQIRRITREKHHGDAAEQPPEAAALG